MKELSIDTMLQKSVDDGASDLHLRVGQMPMIRVKGDLVPVKGAAVLRGNWMLSILEDLLPKDRRDQMKDTLRKEKELDLAYALPGIARFRVNLFMEQKHLSGVMRRIPEDIPRADDIGLPAAARNFANLHRGLVLVTGPTGSGKSTSLAAILRLINESKPVSMITLEDPIEFVHQPVRAVIRQREVGSDVLSFSRGLRAALRQDPDVILIGEMRDRETIEIALTAAETGHLVFGTLHTRSAESTIDRVIDVFPAGQQDQIRTQLSNSLAGIMCQTLLPTADGEGRCGAHEILLATNAVRNLIRMNKASGLRSAMQTQAKLGMQTMDRSLADLARMGKVDTEIARERAQDENEFNKLLSDETQSFRLQRSRGDKPPSRGSGPGVDMGGNS